MIYNPDSTIAKLNSKLNSTDELKQLHLDAINATTALLNVLGPVSIISLLGIICLENKDDANGHIISATVRLLEIVNGKPPVDFSVIIDSDSIN
jgi:hypothetical protein